jgi:hypothetical protein
MNRRLIPSNVLPPAGSRYGVADQNVLASLSVRSLLAEVCQQTF